MRCQGLLFRCRHGTLAPRRVAYSATKVPRATSQEGPSLPALVFSGLAGEWTLHRRIKSALPSEPSGEVHGTATFKRPPQAEQTVGGHVAVATAATVAGGENTHSAKQQAEAGAAQATLQASPLDDGGVDPESEGGCPLFHAPPPAGDLLYGEQGEFRTASGARFRVRRQYVYGYSPDDDQVDVFFAAAGGARDYLFHTMRFDADDAEGSGMFLDGRGITVAGVLSMDEPTVGQSLASVGAGGWAAGETAARWPSYASVGDDPDDIAAAIAANNIVPGNFFRPAEGDPADLKLADRLRGSGLISASLSTGEFGDECGGPWWWATAKGEHPCDQDVHLVSYRFEFRGLCLAAWKVTYEVKGPNVDYVASASYRRPNNSRGRKAL